MPSNTPPSGSSFGDAAHSRPAIERVVLPERLVTATREEWREEVGVRADAAIERAATEGGAEVVLDLRDTREIDVSGLGLLVVVRQRAHDRGLAVRLRGLSPGIRSLLAHTRLDALFLLDE